MARGKDVMTRRRPARSIAAGLLLLLLLSALAACGGDSGGGDATGNGDDGDNGDREMAADFPIIVSQGQEVLGGEQVAMASLLGQRPVVLNFWAAECPPCRAELPEFQRFHENYADRVLVLGIDLGQFTGQGTPEQGRELLAELGVRFPAGYTEDASALPNYAVLGLPTTVFINADGSVFTKWTGALNEEVLVEKAEEMLGG